MNTAQAVQEKPEAKSNKVYKIALTGLFAALSYVVFTFLQFKIYLPGGDATSIHLGNAVCVLGALLLGGFYGGLGGAIGMTIGDLFDPKYVFYAPKTFILKLCIGLIAGFVAHKIAHITDDHDQKYIFKWSLIASVAGLGFNVVMDPIVGYFYKNYVLGVESSAAKIMATWAAGATFINAVAGTIVVVVVYMAVRPVLKKAGLFFHL